MRVMLEVVEVVVMPVMAGRVSLGAPLWLGMVLQLARMVEMVVQVVSAALRVLGVLVVPQL
jgi:hypothetical protein